MDVLLSMGANVRLHDSQALESFSELIPESPGRVAYFDVAENAALGAHVLSNSY